MEYSVYANGKNLLIRPLQDDDFEQYQILIKKVAAESPFTYHYVNEPEINKDNQIKLWHSPYRHALAVFDGCKMVGYSCIYVTNPDHPYLKHNGGWHIYLLKDYTAIKLGGTMLDLLEKQASSLGIKRISVHIHADNIKSLKLCEKRGYEIESIAKKRYYVANNYIDCYEMVKWVN